MTPEERSTHAALHAALEAGDHDTVAAITKRLDAEDTARRERLTRPEALLEAALWYARQGMLVFPLLPGEKKPLPGSRGFKDATTDLGQIRAWWAATPQANIGLPTGHRFDVIDVDLPEGYRSLGDLRGQGLLPDIKGRVMTASGGTHLYIAPTGSGNRAGVGPGIDYRGADGYVVAPPSRTAEGMWLWTTPLELET